MSANMAMEDAVGILGGSFNPVHIGHVRLAEEIQKRCAFDPLWIVPNYRSPHKDESDIDPKHRLEMVKLAFANVPDTKVSTFELDQPGPSYTINTVEYIQSQCPGKQVFFILGTDAFYDLPQWHQFPKLLKSCSFIVVTRAGFEASDVAPENTKLAAVIEELREEKLVKNTQTFGPFNQVYQTSPTTNICVFEASLPEVSSTEVRLRMQLGVNIDNLVPANVAHYLNNSDLYGKKKP